MPASKVMRKSSGTSPSARKPVAPPPAAAAIVAIDAYATRSHSMSIEGRRGRYRAMNSSTSRAICTLRGDSDSAAIAGSGSGNRAQACSYDSPPR